MVVVSRVDTYRWFAFSMLIVFTVGCAEDSKTLEVTGKVTYRGKPLTRGAVVFAPEQGRPPDPVHIDQSGGYKIKVPQGNYRVGVISMPDVSELGKSGTSKEEIGPVSSLIPRHYGNPATSGVVLTVGADKQNDYDINLK